MFLSNSSGKVYPLKIIELHDDRIKVGLPGGLPGPFKVEVTLPATTGDAIAIPANANDFDYLFSITSVTPQTGSYYGGTLLTITGVNFSPDDSDTLVNIGA